jgi:ketosteroid isomerase-like protein
MYLLPMIFSLVSIFFTATFLTPVATANPSGTNPNDPSIVEGADAYLKAVLAGDLPTIVAMFQENAIMMPPNQSLLQGRTAIEQFYGGLCHGPVKLTAFTFTHLESRIVSDTAYDVGTYRQTLAVSPGRTLEDVGKYSVILKRAGDEWKIAYLIFNSDLPPRPTTNSPTKVNSH